METCVLNTQVTDDRVCLVSKREQAQDGKKTEKFHSQLTSGTDRSQGIPQCYHGN